MIFTPSPFEKYYFKNELFYIKRDDLLHIDFSGNKARKFEYFLINTFPHVKQIVSFGSNQSNAMYSLSVLAKMKGWKFIYFCDHIPSFLEQNPVGNYKYALKNGMDLRLTPDKYKYANSLKDSKTIIVQEGGRQIEAQLGIKNLAWELISDIEKENIKNPYIFLPSGTGTTALLL
jgi:1-aminocyclopropane-1-carboxylate deaminase/D-cysteine desulfhydrase-like pyridoxal-dependent ACC family enzyme